MIFETQRIELDVERLCPHWGEVLVSLQDIYSKSLDPTSTSKYLFPDRPGIYFVLCQDKYWPGYWRSAWSRESFMGMQYKILYIGKALSFYDRWQNHHRLPQFLMYGCKEGLGSVQVSCMCFGKEMRHLSKECRNDLLLKMERECIEYFKPILNRTPVYDGELSNQEIIDFYSIPLIEE